ncbi:MAG: tellurium resistance protein TerC [Geobacteraceae bacterium GWC2_58_44]|nr:MAG: tellurium resistance protein TerC [Geobacteraceae bacterium GWC2_58_44]HBG07822.1 tellurium resistance protein TerC [Geobacter sp.]
MSTQTIMWLAFGAVITAMFVLDLFVFNRKSHEIRFREALTWTLVWVGLAMAFNAGVWYYLGKAKALEFLTGYIIEESLSVDNLFVFIMIFSYFRVPRAHQPRVLKWGIIGALVMRGIFIILGIELIERFHWMVYLFGAILIYTGIKMAFGGDEKVEPEKNPLVRLVRRFMPITKRMAGDRFFIKRRGILAATPLFLTLIVVESSDLIFAVDSIPAVLAVTRDPFIVYSSNVFAIMGLRSLYYLLAHVMEMFAYLKLGVSCILAFVGAKMLLVDVVEIPLLFSLGVIIGTLTISILVSVILAKRPHRR